MPGPEKISRIGFPGTMPARPAGDEEHLRIYDEEQYADLSSHDL
jgi:hypothetical protein